MSDDRSCVVKQLGGFNFEIIAKATGKSFQTDKLYIRNTKYYYDPEYAHANNRDMGVRGDYIIIEGKGDNGEIFADNIEFFTTQEGDILRTIEDGVKLEKPVINNYYYIREVATGYMLVSGNNDHICEVNSDLVFEGNQIVKRSYNDFMKKFMLNIPFKIININTFENTLTFEIPYFLDKSEYNVLQEESRGMRLEIKHTGVFHVTIDDSNPIYNKRLITFKDEFIRLNVFDTLKTRYCRVLTIFDDICFVEHHAVNEFTEKGDKLRELTANGETNLRVGEFYTTESVYDKATDLTVCIDSSGKAEVIPYFEGWLNPACGESLNAMRLGTGAYRYKFLGWFSGPRKGFYFKAYSEDEYTDYLLSKYSIFTAEQHDDRVILTNSENQEFNFYYDYVPVVLPDTKRRFPFYEVLPEHKVFKYVGFEQCSGDYYFKFTPADETSIHKSITTDTFTPEIYSIILETLDLESIRTAHALANIVFEDTDDLTNLATVQAVSNYITNWISKFLMATNVNSEQLSELNFVLHKCCSLDVAKLMSSNIRTGEYTGPKVKDVVIINKRVDFVFMDGSFLSKLLE